MGNEESLLKGFLSALAFSPRATENDLRANMVNDAEYAALTLRYLVATSTSGRVECFLKALGDASAAAGVRVTMVRRRSLLHAAQAN